MLSRLLHAFLPLCILAVASACYLPGLSGSFILDDGTNIVKNSQLHIERLDFASIQRAALAGGSGPLKRPISMASFALDYHAAGLNAHHFKTTNLGIHLANGFLVFFLSIRLLNLHRKIWRPETDVRPLFWIAAAVSAAWVLHPFNLTAVLYVVQRMTSLSTFFTLSGLTLYLFGRQALLDGRRLGFLAIIFALVIATPLAVLSKENGALLPFFILITEATLLRWRVSDGKDRPVLITLLALSTVVPLLLGALYVALHPSVIMSGYAMRDFTLSERLMTEARVLWFYINMTLLPNLGQMGLHHDDISISRHLFAPLTTLSSIIGLLLAALGAFALRNRFPLLAFGTAFFFVGHALESSILPLEIAFEHRNYLPMLGILLPFTYYTLAPELNPSSLRLRQASLAILLVFFAGLTLSRAYQWGDPLQMRILEVQRHPLSVRANTDLAALYDHMPARSPEEARIFYAKAQAHYRQAAENSSSNISGLLGLLVINAERNMQQDPTLIKTLEMRLPEIPSSPPNINALIGTARCIAGGQCIIDPEIVNRLYHAALSNPKIIGAYRDQLVFEFSGLSQHLEHNADYKQ